MKKVLSVLALMAYTTFGAVAQDHISIGPMAGFNISRLSTQNNHWKTGLNLGGFLNYSRNERTGLRVEALYSNLGNSYTANNVTTANNLHYVQVPVLATMYLNDRGSNFRPKLMVGPYVGFLTSAKNNGGANLNDGGNYYNTIDFGGKAAAGFNYRLGGDSWLNYELYYAHGLTNISKVANTDARNQGWGMNLGVSFPLSK